MAEGEPVDGDRAVFAPTPSWPLCKAKYYVFLFCIFLCCTLYYLYIYIQPSLSFCFASQSVHFAGIALCSAHQQLVTKGRSHLRFSGFCPLRGPPPPTPLTENQCEKKKVFFLNGIGGYPPPLNGQNPLKRF